MPRPPSRGCTEGSQYAENRKVRDYHKTELAKSHDFNGDFIPIAYEVHGTWGKGALKAAKKLYSAASDFMTQHCS
jgi:hypothetical protein